MVSSPDGGLTGNKPSGDNIDNDSSSVLVAIGVDIGLASRIAVEDDFIGPSKLLAAPLWTSRHEVLGLL